MTNLKSTAGCAFSIGAMQYPELPAGAGPAGGSPDVVRMMYASEANVHSSVYTEMERIRSAAVRNNAPEGVHTALLYQAGWFLQWKEGPGPALLRIMDRVVKDPRHHSLRIVHSSRGPRLLTGPWSMAIVLQNEQQDDSRWEQVHRDMGHDISTCVAQLLRDMERGIQYAPPAIWRRLSMPVRSQASWDIADASLQSVLVCAAAGRQPFELVSWLSARHGCEVVHRRYANAQHLDVGTDYVDCPKEQGVLRVISMARNGLAIPLTRALLTNHSHLVMLLAADSGPNRRLLERVGDALAGLAPRPALLGVAGSPAVHAEMSALAGDWGLPYRGIRVDCRLGSQAVWQALQTQLAPTEQPEPPWPIEPMFANLPLAGRGAAPTEA